MVENPNPQRFRKGEPVWFCFDIWEGIIRADVASVMCHPNFDILHLSHPVWSVRGPDDFNVCSNLLFGNHNVPY